MLVDAMWIDYGGESSSEEPCMRVTGTYSWRPLICPFNLLTVKERGRADGIIPIKDNYFSMLIMARLHRPQTSISERNLFSPISQMWSLDAGVAARHDVAPVGITFILGLCIEYTAL